MRPVSDINDGNKKQKKEIASEVVSVSATNTGGKVGRARAVRFSSSLEESIPSVSAHHGLMMKASEMNPEDKKRLWWRSKDIKRFKEESHMISAELQKADKSHVVPFSYTNTIMRIFQACLAQAKDPHDAQLYYSATHHLDRKQLDRWMGVGTLRVGLEKKIVRSMARGCTALRAKVIQGVLDAQEKTNGDPEAIRQASLRLSMPTQLFATIIGHSVSSSCAKDYSLDGQVGEATSSPEGYAAAWPSAA